MAAEAGTASSTKLSPLALRDRVRSAWEQFRAHGWAFAEALAEVIGTKAYLNWGYGSAAEWARHDLGVLNRATISRLAEIGAVVARADETSRERGRHVPLWNAVELLALIEKEPAAALELAESGATQSQLRQEVRKRLPDQHYDATGLCRVTALVSETTRAEWQAALNVVRCLAGSAAPTDDELIRCIAAEIRGLPLPQRWAERLADVEGGLVRCVICGSWNAEDLESHHCLPKSHQGHSAPQALLCHACHEMVTQNRDGWSWRKLAAKLGVAMPDENEARV